jgi:hypothetical protein
MNPYVNELIASRQCDESVLDFSPSDARSTGGRVDKADPRMAGITLR